MITAQIIKKGWTIYKKIKIINKKYNIKNCASFIPLYTLPL